MTPIDVGILSAFALWAIVSGLRARSLASRDLEEYFLAGRTLRGWQAGISMAATQFAADTPLLVTGMIATAGIFSLWRLWIYAVSFLLVGWVLAACWRRAGVLTDAEFTELRYGGRPAAILRAVKAIYFGTVFNCVVLAMVLYAAKEIAEPFLFWDRWLPESIFGAVERVVQAIGVPFARGDSSDGGLWIRSTNNLISVLAIAGTTLFYSATGGLRGVVRTDLVQFALAMGGTALYAFFVVDAAGGLDAMHAKLSQIYGAGGPGGLNATQLLAFTPDHAAQAGAALLTVIGLQWLLQMNADGTGYLAQRAMACRSDRDARQAAVVFTVAQVLIRSLIWLPIGLGLLVVFPASSDLASDALVADREASFVRGIRELLPVGALGVMLTALFAALASTVDTHLNWGASYWTHDLYARFVRRGERKASARELVWVARASTIGILALSLVIMTQLGSIGAAWRVSLLLGAGMGVMLLLRWIWWRVTALGELVAIAASLFLAPLALTLLPDDQDASRLLLVAGGASIAGVAASLGFGPETPTRLRAFYVRVRPPGFWGPVAADVESDARAGASRLLRGLGATAATALSIFCLLAGAGTWLARSPVPFDLVSRPLWVACLLIAGALLFPIGLRIAAPVSGRPSPVGEIE